MFICCEIMIRIYCTLKTKILSKIIKVVERKKCEMIENSLIQKYIKNELGFISIIPLYVIQK